MELLCFLVFSICLLFSLGRISSAADTITSSQSLSDGKSLVSSPGGIFELGFFSPGISKSRYLGIWYKNIPTLTVVWVANRQTPINGSTGSLMINSTGNLVLVNNNNNQTFWSANSSKQSQSQSPVLQLLDNGNLVLRDEKDANSENYLWQSFDYPSDTLLPGMKLGWDLRTGLNRRLTAWKSPDDPSPGDFIWEMELHEYPEPVMWKGSKEYLRSGPWNGVSFSGKPTKALAALNFSFISNEDEVYMTIHMVNKSVLGRMIMNQTTSPPHRREWIWSEADRNWTIYATFPRDPCDNYGQCGGNGNCDLNSFPICQCLDRFSPRSLENWNLNEFSQGCERRKPLSCKNDGFATYPGLKLPDTTHSWVDKSMNLKECRAKCLSNCSCSAYTNLDVRGGSGCAIWFDELVDIKQMPIGDQDIYINISASELDDIKTSKPSGVKKKVAIIASVGLLVMGVIILGLVFYKRKKTLKAQGKMKNIREKNFDFECGNEDMELITFNLATVSRATDNFSNNNKLGEGGFGPVYKGVLIEGQDIAVKRLSKCSGQGTKEFMNEVILIAKLQHRNLVKLLGCCIEGDEKMLIYEYMPNKSLDSFIFDDTRSKLLGWDQRINIVGGIARGLLYLHQDSRLRIIHRDLKTSNVLLDKDMNPKISDFGTARAFRADQTEENTNRVVGTYGYMSPEYVVDGLFSIKSDVYSFGVMMLEIVSRKKNRGFYHPDHQLNLLGHAWTLWIEGRPLEVMDEVLDGSCPLLDVSRCIHIALLCVQQQPEDRPNMASVVLMLGGEGSLPAPKQPGFFTDRNPVEADSSSTKRESHSINDMSVTLLEAR